MTIKLPLAAKDLVEAAQSQLNEETERVRDAMQELILPKAIEAIFACDPETRELVKSNPNAQLSILIGEVTRILWSYPGSFGASRICKTLEIEGFSPRDADRLTESILNYTRYPMSIVNFTRHLGSAINSIRNIWNETRVSDSVLKELGYSPETLPELISSIESIAAVTIRDDSSFRSWLSLVEDHLNKYMSLQVRINRYASGRPIPPQQDRQRSAESPVARAYVRRFGNYVAAHAGLVHQSTRTDGAAATVNDEFMKLLAAFEGSPKDIFKLLEADYEVRARRLKSIVRRPSDGSNQFRITHNPGIEQRLTINGKKVEIRTSRTSLSPSLIEQFFKSFVLQYKLDPETPTLSTRMSAGGEFIEIEVEKPEKPDLKKIQTFIESMYLD